MQALGIYGDGSSGAVHKIRRALAAFDSFCRYSRADIRLIRCCRYELAWTRAGAHTHTRTYTYMYTCTRAHVHAYGKGDADSQELCPAACARMRLAINLPGTRISVRNLTSCEYQNRDLPGEFRRNAVDFCIFNASRDWNFVGAIAGIARRVNGRNISWETHQRFFMYMRKI